MGQIDHEALVRAVELLELVPQIGGVTSSDYLRVTPRKNKIEIGLASSLTGVVRVDGELGYEKEFYVARKVFSPFVVVGKDIKKKFVSVVSDGKWTLKQGYRKAEFVIRKEAVSGYGQWLGDVEAVALSEETKKLLAVANRCAGSDPSLPSLNCVYLDGKLIMASNQTVVFMADTKNSKMVFPFPTNVIGVIGHKAVESVSIEGNRILVKCGFGHLEGTVTAATKKSFPKDGVVSQMAKASKWPVIVTLPSENLKRMLERLAACVLTEEARPQILLETGNRTLTITVKMGHGVLTETDSDSYYTTVSKISWPFDLVKPVLDYITENADKVLVQSDEKKNSPYLITGAGVKLLVARKSA